MGSDARCGACVSRYAMRDEAPRSTDELHSLAFRVRSRPRCSPCLRVAAPSRCPTLRSQTARSTVRHPPRPAASRASNAPEIARRAALLSALNPRSSPALAHPRAPTASGTARVAAARACAATWTRALFRVLCRWRSGDARRETPDPALPVCVDGRCTDPCAQARSTPGSLGCEFRAATTANYVSSAFSFAVSLSNPQRYPVRVRVTGGALPAMIERTIAPGAVEAIPLPWVPALSRNMQSNLSVSTLAPGGAYRITTTAPVAAYQFNPLYIESARCSRRATTLRCSCRPRRSRGGTSLRRFRAADVALFAIVGTSAATTTVTLRASVNLVAGDGVASMAAGSTTTLTLQAGDVVQIMPELIPMPGMAPGTRDPSGSTIEADHPVAALQDICARTSPRTTASAITSKSSRPPLDTRTDVIVTPFADRPDIASVVRITAQRDATMVTFEPPARTTLCRSQRCRPSSSRAPRRSMFAPTRRSQWRST